VNLALLLEMAASADRDRVALGPTDDGLTAGRLLEFARGAAALIASTGAQRVVYAAESSPVLPVALFGAAWAGTPFVPVNYRLADDRLRAIVAKQAPAMLVADAGTERRFAGIDGVDVLTVGELLRRCEAATTAPAWSDDPDGVAVLLHTSGTSGEPKVAVLRHRHLTSYVLGSVEFLGSDRDEATLASVPPYHIAGLAGTLTAVYGGRRLVQLPAFDPQSWVDLARRESITHAMTVPTMLARILDVIDPDVGGDGLGAPSLRHLSYGGGRMPMPVIERAMRLFPGADFVNAYGLTETSSSIAVLTPEDHRRALDSDDVAVRRRLGSVGRPLPTVEITVRDADGDVLPAGSRGEIWVRGEQVSGEYLHPDPGAGSGWFRTRDGGWFDSGGYLYVEGRMDDVIVRGGENLSPGEIEDVLLEHPAVREAAVVGIPDDEWGEAVAAVVVRHEGAVVSGSVLCDHVVARLRSSRRPSVVEFRDELPVNETGKVLRRVLRDELAGVSTSLVRSAALRSLRSVELAERLRRTQHLAAGQQAGLVAAGEGATAPSRTPDGAATHQGRRPDPGTQHPASDSGDGMRRSK
jgi:acyl-CoA synthetase (AMP-forming)/AMP-acid ligase II